MQFSQLSELSSLLKPAQEEQLTEAKSSAGDFDGIRSVIEDALGDLNDKVEALMDLAKSTGAMKLDTVKDKDGMTVFKKIDKLTSAFKKDMTKLMAEAEAMVMQVAEAQTPEGEVITEGKDYNDSAEFTEEFYGVVQKVNDIKKVVKSPRFMSWMKITDHNFATSAEQAARDVVSAADSLHTAVHTLESEIDKAA